MPRKTRSFAYSDDIAGTWILYRTPDGFKYVALVRDPVQREYWRKELPNATKDVQEFNGQMMTRGDESD